MIIFFDFDGTIVEIMKRDYAVYCDSLPPGEALDFSIYLELRRKKTDIKEILSRTHLDYHLFLDDFLIKRESIMEDDKYLSFDSVLPGVHEVLAKINQDNECHIVSARKDEHRLRRQCRDLGLDQYFSSIVAVSRPETKGSVISSLRNSGISIMVGDTENDIVAANMSGCISVAVDTGIRDQETLRSYRPDYIIVNLEGLVDIIDHVRQR